MKIFGFEIRKLQNADEKAPQTYASDKIWNVSPYMSVGQLLANSSVSACVNIIADAVAVLAFNEYERTPTGRKRADGENINRLIHTRPNDEDTPFTFKQRIMLHLLLKGNAYIFKKRNADYSIQALIPLDPERTTAKYDADGNIYYEYSGTDKVYKYRKRDILHIPAIRYNALRGMSPIEYATHAARLGLTLDEYTENSFDGGLHAKLLIEVPVTEKSFGEEDARKASERIMNSYGGMANANKPLILSKGMKGSPINLANNEENKLVENRQFSEKEIAKIYRVPLFMLGSENSKFTNQEQANTFFLQHTLTPWIVRLQEYFQQLIPSWQQETHYVEFDTNTMLRADYATRWTAYRENFKTGLFSLNNILDMENMPRVSEEFGDKHFILQNYATIDKVAEKPVN